MAISSSTRKAGPFLGNDATAVFPFAFKVFAAADLLVVNTSALGVESDLVLDVDYTVTLNADQDNDPGGSVTRASALPTGQRLTITSDVEALQPLVLTNNGGFYPRVINDAFDKITIIAQQLIEQVGRSLKLPISSTASATLPDPVANRLIAWNSSANGFANIDPASLATVAAYADAKLELFNGNGTQTAFTLTEDPAVLANLDVSISGVTQVGGEDFTWIGTTLTFLTAPPAGTRIQVRYTRAIPPADLAAAVAAAEADRVATAADRVQTGLDRAATAADAAATAADAAATAADRAQTGLDRVQTGLDRVATAADAAATADKVAASALAASTGAELVGSIGSVAGSVPRTQQDINRETVSAEDLGAVGDGTTNNATAFGLIETAVEAGVTVHFPYGIYASSVPLNFTSPGYMTADPGTRIKLTAAANYVIQFDFTAGGPFFDHLHGLTNFVLDGNGFALDGLNLKGALSGYFDNVRATNVTRAGFHLGWAQQCFFLACHCSKNVEPFTTTPVNAWLIDTAASSANTFEHCQISGASGDGVRAISLFNSTFLSCTSEGNTGAGYRFGVAGSGFQCLSNTVLGGDVEVNAGGDFVIDNTAIDTNIIGAKAGFGTTLSVRVMSGAAQTLFLSGCIGAAQVDSGAIQTRFDNVSFIGVGAGLTDAGSGTSWRGLRNFSDGVITPDSTANGYVLTDLAAAGTYNTDAKLDRVHMINATGATLTIANPTNAVAGQKITYVIGNYSFSTLAITWGSAFRAETWVSPPHGEVRSISFSYDSNFGKWNPVAITALSPLAAVADLTVTATSGSLPTANGSVTIANAATPTVSELLEFCVELEAKVEALSARLRSAGVIVP